MDSAKTWRETVLDSLRLLGLFLLLSLLSVLLHELGHCVFYWAQGIPAGMSLVKEYPLRDISELEYAIGSAGGPLSNILQLAVAVFWVHRWRPDPPRRTWALAFVLANVCYFIVRSGIAVLSGDGGELTDAASLFGLDYRSAILLFLVLSAGALIWTTRAAHIRITPKVVLKLPGLLVLYFIFLVAVQTLDRALFWERFPTIEIGEDRLYNQRVP